MCIRDSIQLAIYTQGVKTIEQFLIVVAQSQNINNSNTSPHYQQTRINYQMCIRDRCIVSASKKIKARNIVALIYNMTPLMTGKIKSLFVSRM